MRLLAIVHRPEPQPARGIDDAVVEPVVGQVRLDLGDQVECAARLVEMVEPGLQAGDEPAALGGKDEADLLGRVPAAPVAARRVEAVDLLLLDVDEPQGAVALDPDRPFAELGGELPDGAGRVAVISAPARVDEIFVAGNQPRIVRREEQRRSPRRPPAPAGACRHCASTISASPSGVYHLSWRGVRTLPGTTQLTRILSGAEIARERAGQAFDRRLAGLVKHQVRASARCQLIEPRLTIAPPPFARIPGTTACAQKNWCFRFTLSRSSQ